MIQPPACPEFRRDKFPPPHEVPFSLRSIKGLADPVHDGGKHVSVNGSRAVIETQLRGNGGRAPQSVQLRRARVVSSRLHERWPRTLTDVPTRDYTQAGDSQPD